MKLICNLALLAFACLLLFEGITWRKGSIQRSLESKTRRALTAKVPGLKGQPVSIDFIGRAGVVRGTVDNPKLLVSLESEVARMAKEGRLAGVRTLDSALAFRRLSYVHVEFSRTGVLTLTGALSEPDLVTLKTHLKDTLSPAEFANHIETLPQESIGSAPWLEPLAEVLPQIMDKQKACDFTLRDRTVSLTGTVPSLKDKSQLESLFLTTFTGSVSHVANRTHVLQPKRESWLNIRIGANGGVTLTGEVPDAVVRTDLLRRVYGSMSETDAVKNELKITKDVAEGDWYAKLDRFLPSFFSSTFEGTCKISNEGVDLTGQALNPEKADALAKACATAFPKAELAPLPVVSEELIVEATAGGRAIKAPVPDPIEIASLEPSPFQASGDTSIHFGSNNWNIVGKNLAELRKFAAEHRKKPGLAVVLRSYSDPTGIGSQNKKLPQFRAKAVKTLLGGMGIPAKLITVEEAGPEEPTPGEEWKQQRVELFASGSPVTERHFVSVDPNTSAAPEATPPPPPPKPEPKSIIFFSKNSASLWSTSHPKIKAMAQAVKSSDQMLIISGFADPTGDAELNLALSKQRCEAAHAELLSLGVPADRMRIDEKDTSEATKKLPSRLRRRVEFSFSTMPAPTAD